MKIALIETHPEDLPILGLGYIASYMREKGFSDISINEPINKLKGVDVVGITSVTQYFNEAQRMAKQVKEMYDVPVIVGGPHISLLPHTLPDCFDIGVIGEGELTMTELAQNNFEPSENMKGICYREQPKAKVKITEKRPFIDPLDQVPFPARDLMHIEKETSMMTSRGCPYKCVFCSATQFWKYTRYFSVDYVISEIKEIVEKFKVKTIGLQDDLFIGDKNRLKKIVEGIEQEKINEKVNFSCTCRANLVNDEIMTLLERMNVTFTTMGLESGSEKTLSYLKCGTVSVKQNQEAVDCVLRHKIAANGSFIIGAPNETKEDMMQTHAFVKRTEITGAVYPLIPLPGTIVWEYAKQKGFVSDYMDWDILNINDFSAQHIMLTDKVTRQEFKQIYELIKKEFDKKYRAKRISLWGVKQFAKNPKKGMRVLKKMMSN